jgi:hypothetical protein
MRELSLKFTRRLNLLKLILFSTLVSSCLLITTPAKGEGDDNWFDDESPASQDGNQTPAKRKYDPFVMGPAPLNSGVFGARLSTGLYFINLGAHAGLAKNLEALIEGMTPYNDFGGNWMAGGGIKVKLHGERGKLQYSFKLKTHLLFHRDSKTDSSGLLEGLSLWPSFMIGMDVQGGCFYGEVGFFLMPYATEDSGSRSFFYGMPAHFGGEMPVTDSIHIFINVDILLATPYEFFITGLRGPFNMAEVGMVYLF